MSTDAAVVAARRLATQLRNAPRQQYFRLTRQEVEAIIAHVERKEK